ncbi:hypothetical protein [Kitasatospora sp. NPDC056181]|uniref:hypothetical protein n=1 Tax=Kitasatospora sp. NPDC056181 TaxID=3345737 RepID=UPI0035E17868
MSTVTTPATLVEVAGELRRLGQQCADRRLPGALLGSVAETLESDPGALGGMDLAAAYPPDLLAPDGTPRHGRVADVVEAVRDVLVFLPIAVTWTTLWIDLGRYRAAGPGANFLRLWLDGAGKVAVPTVVVLVALVIVLNAGLHLHAATQQRATDHHWLRQSIAQALMRATHILAITASVRTKELSTTQLENTARLLARSADQLEKGLGSLTNRLLTVLSPGPEGQFSTALQEWTASARELGTLGRAMTMPQEVLNRFVDLRNQLANEDRELHEAVRRLAAEVRDTSAVSQVAAQAQQKVAVEVMEDTRQLGEALENFVQYSDRLRDFMDGLDQFLHYVRERTEVAITGPEGTPPAMSNVPGYESDPYGFGEPDRSRRTDGPEFY